MLVYRRGFYPWKITIFNIDDRDMMIYLLKKGYFPVRYNDNQFGEVP
jgi:hypothetical protein